MSNVYRYYLYAFSNMGRDKDGKELTLADFPVAATGRRRRGGSQLLTNIVQQPEPGDTAWTATPTGRSPPARRAARAR